jgi:hypothetical protein
MSEATATVSIVSDVVEIAADAPRAISNIFDYAERIVYGVGYTAAFVLVFPVALVFAVIPKGNALVQGVIEGSADARSRAEGMVA